MAQRTILRRRGSAGSLGTHQAGFQRLGSGAAKPRWKAGGLQEGPGQHCLSREAAAPSSRAGSPRGGAAASQQAVSRARPHSAAALRPGWRPEGVTVCHCHFLPWSFVNRGPSLLTRLCAQQPAQCLAQTTHPRGMAVLLK